MKRFVQIVSNTAYWIFEAEELPPYPNPEDFLDITDKPEVQEGWIYNSETGEFTAPVVPDPTPIESPSETIEQKMERLEQQLEAQQQQNLILLDVNMTIYEELLTVQERLNNA